MPAPKEIRQLIDRFERNLDDYRSPGYPEAQVRIEFINPLFQCLGWDIDNTQGFAEAYKDVIHEDAIKIGGATKAPDYCFRVGGTRKFFLEAKKPAINIKQDPVPAYQLRRYAWSAGLPLSVLTDFEEFAVYDCRVRPALADKASAARTQYLTYRDYPERWDDIAGVFARDAVLKGSFDKYAESSKVKRGTATVDAAFLQEIEHWRDLLAKNFALRNPRIEQRDLNYAVQVTIDRLLFLRMCEDRGIEQYGQLQGYANGDKVYARLFQLFRAADDRYNSGLFYFHKEEGRSEPPDELTPSLKLDDKPLKDILRTLYYPESPYEFSVLPAEILGQVYEQFLGKVIRLTESHQAKIEEKPEVRKAGGVYYTPTYIVDYIVKNTVGKLLGTGASALFAPLREPESESHAEARSAQREEESKSALTPRQAAKLRILDPACGSGSFLLGAYRYLLDWHRDWYVADGADKHTKVLYQGPGGAWRLTTAEKRRILLNNIYGVDIDPQAVETTKLSLLLKVLEGESKQTLEKQLLLFHERALPDLASNIKCGNSLIGPDFYEGQQGTLFDDEERYRINVFDWNAEFPAIMKAGGFDAVIGNPPYGADYDGAQKRYFQSQYVYKEGKPETYIFFLERGMALLGEFGMLGFITPNAWLTNHYGVQIRRHVLGTSSIDHLVDLEPIKVFEGAVVDTAITILSKVIPNDGARTRIWRATKARGIEPQFVIEQGDWSSDRKAVINLQANPGEVAILSHMESSKDTLERLVEFSQGAIPYESKAQGEANRYIASKPRATGWLPLLENAAQVRRYEVDKPRAFIHYGPWLCRPREHRFFSEPKILFHRLRKKLPIQLVGGFDDTGAINRHSLSNLILRPGLQRETLFAVLGLFNSRLANWWFVKRYGVLMEVGGFKLMNLPLPSKWEEGHARMVALATEMLSLHERLAAAKTAHAKTALERQIAATDRQIDRLVYELYGLTEAEIQIVEEATATGTKPDRDAKHPRDE